MSDRIRIWFTGLTLRERWLVGVAGILAALVVLIYGIVWPVGTALNEAYARHRDVVERTGRIEAGLALLKAAPAVGSTQTGPVDQVVAGRAEEAGFVLQSNQPGGQDMTVIMVPAARGGAVLGWLDSLARDGLAVEAVTVTPGADGSVAVQATLRRAGS